MTLFSISVKYFAIFTIVSAVFGSISSVTGKCAELVLDENSVLESEEEELPTCGQDQFECQNRECIPTDLVCDGRADCSDQSDETYSQCTRPELTCLAGAFRCDYGACVHENAPCNGVKDCIDNSDELLPECKKTPPRRSATIFCKVCVSKRNRGRIISRGNIDEVPVIGSRISEPILVSTKPPRQSRPSRMSRPPAFAPLEASSSCVVPPQPSNGKWRLHKKFCKGNENCKILQGIALPRDRQLVYSCDEGFMINGSSDVYCEDGGSWSSIPTCDATTCPPLTSISIAATCSRFGKRTSCKSSVLPFTRAKVSCRVNYGLEGTFSTGSRQETQCNENGRWDPEPITCSPVCGAVDIPGQRSTALNGNPPESDPFPWHANLWREISTPRGPEREFRCSATIVQTNFVVTAAHCVIDEKTGLAEAPERLRITSGKNANDGSNDGRSSELVGQKVKNVYRYCEAFGQSRGYASDIALVELEDPLEFSPTVLPACLDVSSSSRQGFQPGATGRIGGFGRRSASTPNPTLRNVQATYVSNSDCKIPENNLRGAPVIRDDEFCGAYSDDTIICNWDTGGGFYSQKNGLWYLRGIFVEDLGSSLGVQRACGENPYSLYTKVSVYMPWIQDAMFQLTRYKSYPQCRSELKAPLTQTESMSGTATEATPTNPTPKNVPTVPDTIPSGTEMTPTNSIPSITPTVQERVPGGTATQATPSSPTPKNVPTVQDTIPTGTGTQVTPSNPTPNVTPTVRVPDGTAAQTTPSSPTPKNVPTVEDKMPSGTATEMSPTDPTPTERITIPDTTPTEMSPTAPTPKSMAMPAGSQPGSATPEFSCVVPPQPPNGQWTFAPDLCDGTDCDIPEGAGLPPGSRLVYKCDPGFRQEGKPDVICGSKGQWFTIPRCIEIRCNTLESISTSVKCYKTTTFARCNATEPPGTRAVLSCNAGYTEDKTSLRTGGKSVTCNEKGKWSPNPVVCSPECGLRNALVTPTILDGKIADVTNFPWHATLYVQQNVTQGPVKFICGATIIQDNLVLTAAHCVYDENFQVIETPERFTVAAGNKFRDFDSKLQSQRYVHTSLVKNIYVPCDYSGVEGNYVSDIAIIELWSPFPLSSILLPACLDILGNSEWILQDGAEGQFAGFGRTTKGASSAILLEATIPYVSWGKCGTSPGACGNKKFVVKEKFCGGINQGMAVCTGDSGGGVTFDNDGVSNLMGILSVNLGSDTSNGERTCNRNCYSLYTKVSHHMSWILDVMRHVESREVYPSCGSQ